MLKRGWKGNGKCRFCCDDESIDPMFIHCSLSTYVWGVVNCAFNIDMNLNSVHEICRWVVSFPGKVIVVAVWVAAILRSIWKTRNKLCFDNVF